MKKILSILVILLILPQPVFSALIHDAAEKGDLITVKKLISGGVSPNLKDESGNTPLHWAAMSGNEELVVFLIDQGTNIDSTNELGVSALILAMYTKNYKSAELLSLKGANPNIRDSDKSTAISMAVNSSKWDLVRLFIENGGDPNLTDENGIPPLAYVTEDIGHTMINWLVERGAEVNVKGHYGMTPLHRVVTWKDLGLAEYLIQNGANLDAREASQLTPLYYAIEGGQIEMVELLLEKGANPDIVWREFSNQNYPKTALAFARSLDDRDFGEKVEELLTKADATLIIPPDPCITLNQVLSMNRLGPNQIRAEHEGKDAKIFVLTVMFWEYGSSEQFDHDQYDSMVVIDISRFNLAPMILFKDGCSLNIDSGFINLTNLPALLEITKLISKNAGDEKIKRTIERASFYDRNKFDLDSKYSEFQKLLKSLETN